MVAGFLRASCVTKTERALMITALRFHQSLERDKVENWRDGISLNELMSDRALRAPSTQTVLRHISVSPSVAMISSFVSTRDSLWQVTMRMAQLARRSSRNKEAYESLMSGFRSPSEDVWSVMVDTKMKVYREQLGEFREYSKPNKDGTVPHVDRDAEIDRETKAALVPSQECLHESQLALGRFGSDKLLLQRLLPLSYAPNDADSAVYTNLCLIQSWRAKIAPQHFAALLDSYLRLVSFSEVMRLINCTHELVLALRDAAEDRPVDISKLFLEGRYEIETGENLKIRVERPTLTHAKDMFLLESFCDILIRDGLPCDLQTLKGIENLVSALARDSKLKIIFSKCIKDLEAKSQEEKNPFANDKKRHDEFLNYVIAQRQIKGDSDGQFDQGYWAKKKDTSS